MKEKLFRLLNNFVETQPEVEGTYVYSKEGGLIVRYDKLEPNLKEDFHEVEKIGERLDILKTLIERVKEEFKVGYFGCGSFDTIHNRIIYLEAGFEAIILIVCDFLINLDTLFPLAYLIAEKTAQILEGSFSPEHQTLAIPNLRFYKNFSLGLDGYSLDSPEPLFDNVYPKIHIKREFIRRRLYKLIVVGAAEVGKTTLVNSFLNKDQSADYRPTIGISIAHTMFSIQGFSEDDISLIIFDLAGQKFFKRARLEYYAGASCAIIVYDITRPETFKEAKEFWYEDLRKELGNIPIILIGNKLDLNYQRKVSMQEGESLAEETESLYAETSALHDINVQDTFNVIGIKLFFKKSE